jgi:hypothetical protein
MRALISMAIALVLAGCASTTQVPAGAQAYSGEVWGWDRPNNIVTLYDNGRFTRVKITPDQMNTLRLHDYARVTGTLAPPADVVTVTNTGPMAPVPRGQSESMEVPGTVASVDPQGRMAVTSDRGPLHVWAAPGADQRFTKGSPVIVRMTVQPVEMRPVPAGQPAPTAPAASPSSEPGDHAVITGRIIGVNPGGVLVVESPTGPVQILVADGGKYKVGDWVEVRSTVRTAS